MAAWFGLPRTPETIHVRMSADADTAARRPSLTNRTALDEIVHLLAAREPVYRKTADLEVSTEGRTPEQIADEILAGIHWT